MAILSDIDLGVVKHILASVSVAFILTFALRSVFSWYRLRHIPGPLLPSLTNLPRVFWVKTGQSQNYHRQLHQKYGEVVRMGPNMVSISNPEVIPILYPTRPGFPKVRYENKESIGFADSNMRANRATSMQLFGHTHATTMD